MLAFVDQASGTAMADNYGGHSLAKQKSRHSRDALFRSEALFIILIKILNVKLSL
jgi:hypothetical protein